MKLWIGLFFLAMLLPPSGFAQVPFRATLVGYGYSPDAGAIRAIEDSYYTGDWSKVQTAGQSVLREIHFRSLSNAAVAIEPDLKRDYIFLVFWQTSPDESRDVIRLLLHTPATEEYSCRFPGITGQRNDTKTPKVYEIFLTTEPNEVLISTYTSTMQKDPLESQIPAFAKQFDFKKIGSLFGLSIKGGQELPPPGTYATLSSIQLPHSRAKVEIADVVQRSGKKWATGKSSCLNDPPVRFDFGLISSLVLDAQSNGVRVKIQNGKIAEDPISGSMNLGVVNIHPWPYDRTSEKLQWNQRFRFFTGGVLTPEFGISAGAGLEIVHGFSINAGFALLFIDTPKKGETLGSAPVDSKDPFDKGTARVFFAGGGYNF